MELNKEIANYFGDGKTKGRKMEKESQDVRGLFESNKLDAQQRADAADMLELWRNGYREWDDFTEEEKLMMVQYSGFVKDRGKNKAERARRPRDEDGFLEGVWDAIKGLFSSKGDYSGMSNIISRRRQ